MAAVMVVVAIKIIPSIMCKLVCGAGARVLCRDQRAGQADRAGLDQMALPHAPGLAGPVAELPAQPAS